jgi:hypothetical protein
MQVCLGALDVVVEIVTECVDEVDGLVRVLRLKVAGEQNFARKELQFIPIDIHYLIKVWVGWREGGQNKTRG